MAQPNSNQPGPVYFLVKTFQPNLKSKLALVGYSLLILGIFFNLFLLWNSLTAKNLDSLPGKAAQLSACEKVIEELIVTERVIAIGNETILIAKLSQTYLEQDCPKSTTVMLTAPDFNTPTRQQDIIIVSGNQWQGGAWNLKPKKSGVFQVSVNNGDLVYSAGISVIPRFLGVNLGYESLQRISVILLMFGIFIIFWNIKQKRLP